MAQYDEVIPPGQEGGITLEIDGEKVTGSFLKKATVTTNDPKHPQLTISISGKILPYIDVQPSNRVYLRGMFGEDVEKEVTISSYEKKKDFKIENVTSNIDDKITYQLLPEGEPGRYRLKIYKNPKLPTMNTWGSIYLHSNSEKSAESVVQVNVQTRGSIVVQPSTLNFGIVKQGEEGGAILANNEKSLTVFKIKGDFHIEDVSFSSDFYKADVQPLEDGKKYRVTVSFAPGVVQDAYADEMIITTDDPMEPSLRVRLLARGI